MPDYKEYKGKAEQKDKVVLIQQNNLKKMYNDIKQNRFQDIKSYGKGSKY